MASEDEIDPAVIEESMRLEAERQANVKAWEDSSAQDRGPENYEQEDKLYGVIKFLEYKREIERVHKIILEYPNKEALFVKFVTMVEDAFWVKDQTQERYRNNIKRMKKNFPFAYTKEIVQKNRGPIIDYETLIHSLGLHYQPIEGDGNCFWNAVSWILTGNESQFYQVRQNYLRYMTSDKAKAEATIAGPLFEVSKDEQAWRKTNKYPNTDQIKYLPKEHAKFIESELKRAATKGKYWATDQDAHICVALHGMNDIHFEFRGSGGSRRNQSLRSGLSGIHRTSNGDFKFPYLPNPTSLSSTDPSVLILNEKGQGGPDHYAVSPFVVRKYTSTNFWP